MELVKLRDLLMNSEDILIEKILNYAIKRNYARFVSTLVDAWRISIEGLSDAMIRCIDEENDIPEMNPDIDYSKSKAAQFGVTEAKLHRSRGITLVMFLSFMKYYQQSYEDIVKESNFTPSEKEYFVYYIKRFFDFVELGFIQEWSGISEKKVIEELQTENRNILSEKNKYLTVFESIYDAAIVIDENNKIDNINSKAAELFLGVKSFGFKYNNYEHMKEDLDYILKEISDEVSDDQYGQMIEKEILTKEGPKILLMKIKKLKDVSKKHRGKIVILADITDRVLLEREKAKADITLRNQQKLESIGTLASGVAHEINNPINGILNYGQIIFDSSEKDSDTNKFAREIIRETNRVSKIVSNLLEFSRKTGDQHGYYSIEDIVSKTLSLINTIFKHDNITLNIDIEKNISNINCSSQQIQQVIMNLLTNARDSLNFKYIGYDESKIINIKCNEFVKDENKWISIEIEDFGVGIAEEIKDQIFDPFFTTKTKDKGTGLGLSISYGIVNEHRGEIVVDSKEGEYSRFTINLPCD